MDPRTRRNMLHKMGLMPAIPSVEERRMWEWIDDRIMPEGEPDGQFSSFMEWVNKASSWIGYTGAKCYDKQGRRCHNGADFQRAKEERAFPVSWYLPYQFAEPQKLSKQKIKLITALCYNKAYDANPMTEDQLKEKSESKKPTKNQIFLILGKESLEEGELFRLTDNGFKEAEEIIARARRASYVR